MTSTSVLLILVGLFIIVNASNFVGVINGDKKLSFQGAGSTSASPASGPTGTFTGTTDPRAGK